jgi:hypothetical protein
MTTPVSFELAKLLKEKEFDELCYNYWCNTTEKSIELHRLNAPIKQNQMLLGVATAPTIAEVVMWLYGNYGIWIKVDVASKDFWHPSIVNIEDGNFMVHPSYVSQKFLEKNGRVFNAPTEAYEAAIDYVLNNLIK